MNNGRALCFASETLKNDKYIVLKALKNDIRARYELSEQLRSEIGNNDPIKYLESYLLNEEFQQKIVMKEETKKVRRKI